MSGAGSMTTTDWVRPTLTETGIFVRLRIEIHSWTPITQSLVRCGRRELAGTYRWDVNVHADTGIGYSFPAASGQPRALPGNEE